MARLCQILLASTIAIVPLGSGEAQDARSSSAQAGDPNDVVVVGIRDIVVNGKARRCNPVAGDPLSVIRLSSIFLSDPNQQSVVKTSGSGGYGLFPDDDPLTGPEVWQRAGRGLDQYVFRVTAPDRPICIGSHAPDRKTFAQLRRIIDARTYRGHRLRFTAWVATGDAALVNFWLAAAHRPERISGGGNTNNRPWGGSHGWTPIMIEIGPIKQDADYISYGFLLHGHGDVWMYKPTLSVVADDDPFRRNGDVSVFGQSER